MQQHSEGERAPGTRQPLRAHPLFTPVITVWGALLGGVVTLVLPAGLVLTVAAKIGLGGLDELSRHVLAALAALVAGAAMLIVGKALTAGPRRMANTPSLLAPAVRPVSTIDPARELGSSSLDAPVEAMPFSFVAPENEPETAPEPESPAPPLSLDLAEFAAMPGRNGVWVEEQEIVTELDTVVQSVAAPAPPPVSPGAIERLRAVPISELSLVQMVERFAAALHERQSAPPRAAGDWADMAGREAALAEALKALAALSHDSKSAAGNEPLRDALTRLQELRGAA
jgi:hypothetical protein